MIFFIRYQQNKLRDLTQVIAKEKVSNNLSTSADVKLAIQDANQAYGIYLLQTRSMTGKILSFIPGTNAFFSRLQCSRRIKIANSQLHCVQKEIKNFKTVQPVNTPIRVVKSAPIIPIQPKVFPSPLKQNRVVPSLDDSQLAALRKFVVG